MSSSKLAEDYDFLFKILLVGDSAVGKTSLVIRFTEGDFSDLGTPTIGVDFKLTSVQAEGKRYKLQIWDTAGQEKFRSISTMYFRGAHGVCLVFDLTNPTSFHNLKEWMSSVLEHSDKGVNTIVIGNKSDMKEDRKVDREMAEAWAHSVGAVYLETSAKTSDNVREAFVKLTEDIRDRCLVNGYWKSPQPDTRKLPDMSTAVLSSGEKKKKSCC